jgi:hypothetical protein
MGCRTSTSAGTQHRWHATPDEYSMITEMDETVIDRVAAAMETSAADPQQQAMVESYISQLELPLSRDH